MPQYKTLIKQITKLFSDLWFKGNCLPRHDRQASKYNLTQIFCISSSTRSLKKEFLDSSSILSQKTERFSHHTSVVGRQQVGRQQRVLHQTSVVNESVVRQKGF
jgi:hypothetical protein